MARKIHRAATASIKIQTSITDYHLVAPLIRYPLPDNNKKSGLLPNWGVSEGSYQHNKGKNILKWQNNTLFSIFLFVNISSGKGQTLRGGSDGGLGKIPENRKTSSPTYLLERF